MKRNIIILVFGVMMGVAATAMAAELNQDGLYTGGEQGRRLVPGEDAIVVRLERKARELEARELMLNDQRSELDAAEARLREEIAQKETLRVQIQDLLDTLDARQSAQIKESIKSFEKMRGAKAAKILTETREDVSLELLRGMKATSVSKILAEMDPRKAARLTEKLSEHPASGLDL